MEVNKYKFDIVENYNFVFDAKKIDNRETKFLIQLIDDINSLSKKDFVLLKRKDIRDYSLKKAQFELWYRCCDITRYDLSDEAEFGVYEIPLIDLMDNEEFCFKYPHLINFQSIGIPKKYIHEYDSVYTMNARDYIRIEEETRTNNKNILLMNSDVFRRYVKDTETIILNQNKEATNVVDIKDTISPMLVIDSEPFSDYSAHTMSVTEDRPYFFNPNIAKILGSKTVTIPMLMEMFAVDKYSLKDKLQRLKEKQVHLLMIGLGGTMSNFCYFMNEFAKEFGFEHIFDLLTLYEHDELELSNLFRIPLDYTSTIFYNSRSHLRFLDIKDKETKAKDVPLKAYMLLNCKNLYNNMQIRTEKYMSDYHSKDSFRNYDFVIGSPDVPTRTYFSQNNINNFICPLHYNNDLIIFTNPTVVANELMQETYGSIHLSYFFMNMFRMTLEIIDLMLKDSLDNNAKVLEYSSKADLENIKKNVAKSKNSYIIC